MKKLICINKNTFLIKSKTKALIKILLKIKIKCKMEIS